jgi:ATP-dependent RNA helicase DeaD
VALDEADEMLDMGFAEDIDAILAETPSTRQTILFSATLPARINRLAQRHLTDPVRIDIVTPSAAPGEAPQVRQVAYVVPRAHKAAALGRVLDVETPTAAIVFCRTRNEVDDLTETLNGRGYRAEALHGGINQEQRDRVMARLRGGRADLLVATDVAARGLDIDHLTHVVNYDVPSAPESYVHRVGRVGRAGREGVAITLAEPREHRMLKNIERLTKQKIAVEKVPTVADLRTRRMEVTLATLRESILEDEVDDDGGLDHYRVVVESLTSEFDLMEVALAAVKLAHDASAATGPDDEIDIPDVTLRPSAPERPGRDRPTRGERPRRTPDDTRRGAGRPPSGDMTRLFVGIGHDSRVRPGDLVGAIAGETSLSGRDIGAIQIRDHFSLVEVPESAVDEVIGAIRNTTIKGKKAHIRRERDDPRSRR